MNYFITFRTYETWHHGDERGSVDKQHNQFGEPLVEGNPKLERYRRSLMKNPMLLLDERQKGIVLQTIQEVADHRRWTLHAQKVFTNHVHILLSATATKEKVLADLKAWSTRRLRERGSVEQTQEVWEYHGSTIPVNDAESFERIRFYIDHCQEEAQEPRA